jgi:ubiquitin carboxyl-terminal hydrolase 7
MLLLGEEIANKTLNSVEEEILDYSVHHWEISNWSQLEERTLGPVFEAGGHKW